MAKNRVSPMKQTIIPRLELMGPIIGARLGKYVQENTGISRTFFFGVTVKLFYIGSCSINHQTNLYDTNTCRGSSYDSELNITSLQSIRKLEDRSSFLKLHTLYYLFTTADIQGKGK